MDRYLNRFVYTDELSFDARVLNMIFMVGFITTVASFFFHILEGSNLFILVLKIVMMGSLVLLVIVTNRFNLHLQGKWVAVLTFCFVLFPLIFFQNGGMQSGISAYFVLCMCIIFLLLTGKARGILLVLFILATGVCYFVDIMYPEYIHHLTERQQYMDSIGAYLITGFFIGPVYVVLSQMYLTEKEKAAEASRAKGDFLAQMSHEMRTPMNAVIGMLQISKSSSTLEEQRVYMDRIEDASEHLLGVINDILDMSKIEAGKLDLLPKPFAFAEMINFVVSIQEFRSDGKIRSIDTHIDDRIPKVLNGDKQRLAQIVANLLSNAVKFTPEGGKIAVDATLLREEDGLCTLEIDVTDTGIGITEEEQSRLFQSFEQANNSMSREYGGTGLGLAISKRIAEAMEGDITVESKVGEGSRFTVTVQLRQVSEGERRQVEEAQETLGAIDGIFAGRTGLLVDDVAINREIAEALLEPTGLVLVHAESGQAAVDLFAEQPDAYDLILMDIQMPGMDGYDATCTIRSMDLPAAKRIPIIAMTANVFKEDVERSLEAGMNAHIGKPLNLDSMIRLLRGFLG